MPECNYVVFDLLTLKVDTQFILHKYQQIPQHALNYNPLFNPTVTINC